GQLVVAVREEVRLDNDALSDDPFDRVAPTVDLGLHPFNHHPAPCVDHPPDSRGRARPYALNGRSFPSPISIGGRVGFVADQSIERVRDYYEARGESEWHRLALPFDGAIERE